MPDVNPPFRGLAQSFRIQAAVCGRMGSPFSEAILNSAARDIEDGGVTRRILARWTEATVRDLIADAVALRLLGAIHDLALNGTDAQLVAAYPSTGSTGDPDSAWTAALETMKAAPERFVRFVEHEPQTNEVRRSACLLPGFLTAAREFDLPLRIFELGASAGLNQLWDRYAYALGGVDSWGPADSPVHIPTEWRGPPPPLDARSR